LPSCGKVSTSSSPGRGSADRLAMERVDADAAGAEHRREAASFLDDHVLADAVGDVEFLHVGLAVIPDARQVLNFGCERAAERDVEFLNAATDGEKRHAALQRAGDERQAGRVAAGIEGAVALLGLGSIERGMDVRAGATCQHAVDPVEDLVDVVAGLECRDEEGHDAGAFDGGADILMGNDMPDIAVEFAEIARDGNDRFRHHQAPLDA
jgi:hypothetical protein